MRTSARAKQTSHTRMTAKKDHPSKDTTVLFDWGNGRDELYYKLSFRHFNSFKCVYECFPLCSELSHRQFDERRWSQTLDTDTTTDSTGQLFRWYQLRFRGCHSKRPRRPARWLHCPRPRYIHSIQKPKPEIPGAVYFPLMSMNSVEEYSLVQHVHRNSLIRRWSYSKLCLYIVTS